MTPDERLRVLGEGRLLQIKPTQVSDSGRYLCVATNVAGEDDQDFNVLIQGVWGPWASGTGGGRWLERVSVLWSSLAGGCGPSLYPFSLLRPLAWALSSTNFTTWGHHRPLLGLSCAFKKCG